MSTRKKAVPVNTGRKSAYVARNHAALLKSTQKALADLGPSASIEQFAEVAEVSVSTIYKHFENKDALIAAAYISGFREWELWADEVLKDVDDPLEELVAPMRLMLRLAHTHPLYARMSAMNISEIPKYFPATEQGLVLHIQELIKKKVLVMDNPAIRIRSISACLLAALGEQLFNPKATFADGDAAVEVILGILGITPAKAKRLAYGPLPELTVVAP